MLLSDLTLPLPYADAKALALVFSPSLAARLAELHAQYGSSNCVPMPSMLTDGRLMLCADILTEIMPGGLLAAMWEHADRATVANEVEVIAWADAVAMLPAIKVAGVCK